MKGSRLLFVAGALVFAAGLFLQPLAVWAAESDTGSIDGRVFDETKAAVPGATVTAKNLSTGLTRTAVASSSGTYHIGGLPAGTYDVTAALTGFGSVVNKDVPVQVASQSTVDFTLKVGAMTEMVTVTGETSLIQTTKSDVGQVISQKLVENLPLNGRKFQDLSLLVPGTRSSNYYDPTKTEVGGISYGAGTGRSVIINVDGGDNNDGVVRGLLQQFSAEAIQEYKVTTQRYSAEFGRSVGGVVNVITKSGTNDFRGSAFVFARNQSLNSRTYFEEQAGQAKPDFSQQQFGGSLGGPITKDKAHFFVAYERNRRNDSVQVNTQGVLPSEEGSVEKPFRNHLLTAKLDFHPSDNNNAYVRYSLEDQKRENDFVGGNVLQSSGALNTNKIHSAIAKDTTVMGSNKLNELTVLFQSFENNIISNDNTKPNIITPDFTYGANLNTPQQTIQRRWQVRDDFSFRKEGWGGDHDFKVGAEVLRSHYGGFFIPTLYGAFYFSRIPGGDLNAYLNGVADTFTGSAGTNEADDNWTYLAGYLQDDWKPTPHLTLNLGLRYEIQWGPYSNSFNPVGKAALEAAGFPGTNKNDYNNIGPRVGFAWDVKGDAKVVLRGGYGRYYDEIFQNITLYEKWSDPRTPLNFVTLSPAPFTPNEYAANSTAIRTQFKDPTFAGQLTRITAPDLVQPYSQHANVGFSIQPARSVGLDVDYVHAEGKQEIHRWQINTAANVNTRISPPGVFAPELGPLRIEGNRGHSKFDGVYVAGKYRTVKSQVLATYAWSKGRNLANDFNTRPHDATNADWELDFGPAPNDVRHRATAGAVFELPYRFQLSSTVQWNSAKPYSARLSPNQTIQTRAIDPATGQPFPRNSFREYNPLGTPEFAQFNGKDGRFFTWDARISKMFGLGRERSLEVLFEVFNITNAVNFLTDNNQGFNDVYTASNFGTPTQVVPNSQRQAEFGVRLRF
jgi:outer membrane receptor protein involved in Fe transport